MCTDFTLDHGMAPWMTIMILYKQVVFHCHDRFRDCRSIATLFVSNSGIPTKEGHKCRLWAFPGWWQPRSQLALPGHPSFDSDFCANRPSWILEMGAVDPLFKWILKKLPNKEHARPCWNIRSEPLQS